MKYKNIGIIIKYETTDGERAMTRFRYRGEVNRKQIRKDIKKVMKPLGIRLDNAYVDALIKSRAYDLGLDEA